MTAEFTDLDGLVERISDGAVVALPRQCDGGSALALVRRAIQHGVRDLRLVGAQRGDIAVELLVGAGCVAAIGGIAGAAPAGTPCVTPVADLVIFHAGKVDRHGNVWVGGMRHWMALAQAAKSIVVSYEECVDAAPAAATADTIPALKVAALAEVKLGSWPLGLPGHYAPDRQHLAQYARSAETEEGLQGYLRNHVYQRLAVD